MKKKLCMLLLVLCWGCMSACGNKEAAGRPEPVADTTPDEEAATDADRDDSPKEEINIEELAWEDAESEEDHNNASEDTEKEDANTNDELVDGMRPEFKEAMDSYEAFYNEYCEILKKYGEDPSDTELLADYTDMLSKSIEMTEKFEAWEEDGLNDAELNYYLEVNSRITQKLLEVSE